MDRDAMWAVIAEQRRCLADLLEDIGEAGWEGPSLCAEWRVRDVAAHVALAPQSPGALRILAAGIRARGDFDAVNRELARAHAARAGSDLVAQLRRHADDRRRPAITTLDNLLFDTLVHVQDVALPSGRSVPVPAEAACAAADRVWRMGWPFWARRRLRGVRLTATDAEWAVGDGAEVRGPIKALLLVLTGREAAVLPRLGGPGLDRLVAAAARRDRPRPRRALSGPHRR